MSKVGSKGNQSLGPCAYLAVREQRLRPPLQVRHKGRRQVPRCHPALGPDQGRGRPEEGEEGGGEEAAERVHAGGELPGGEGGEEGVRPVMRGLGGWRDCVCVHIQRAMCRVRADKTPG